MAHPDCTDGHICQKPSGYTCIEPGCQSPAGTWWTPYWCPPCDEERIDRITAQIEDLVEKFQDD